MEGIQLIVDWASRDVFSIFVGFASAIFTFLVGRWLARALTGYGSRSMERAKLDPMIIRFLQKLIFVSVMAAVVIAALSQAGIHTTSLTALLATAGVAIGLSIRDALANLASGVMILLFRPYVIDNFVDAEGTSGLVEEVQIFSTILRTPDNIRVIIPNSAMINSKIKNHSAYATRRIDLLTTIGYDDAIGPARTLLLNLAASHAAVLSEPPPTVEVLDLVESGVKLVLRAWVPTAEYALVRSELLEQMKTRLDAAGIRIPWPQQVVLLYHSADRAPIQE